MASEDGSGGGDDGVGHNRNLIEIKYRKEAKVSSIRILFYGIHISIT